LGSGGGHSHRVAQTGRSDNKRHRFERGKGLGKRNVNSIGLRHSHFKVDILLAALR
jgi:hypothetical protein